MTGTTLNNRYRIHEPIGEGASSIVYRATDLQSGRAVAVKSLKPGALSNRIDDIIRFKNEALMASRLDHPGIVRVFEVLSDGDGLWVIMEIVAGLSLDRYLAARSGTPLSLSEILSVIESVCRALDHVHRRGIVHRDLKPGNIMIRDGVPLEPGRAGVKLVDFGLSAAKDYDWIADEAFPDRISGTLGYMSPEQIRGPKRELDERADLYSLGVVFYEMATGRLPFVATLAQSLIHQHLAKNPEPPSNVYAGIPPVIEKMILKLLNKDPDQRYQSASGLLHDIEKFRSGDTGFNPGLADRGHRRLSRAPMIGREREFGLLKEGYAHAREGSGALFLISGEAGMGKTMLIDEMRRFVFERQGLILSGACFGSEAKAPYGPFASVLDAYLRYYGRLGKERRDAVQAALKKAAGELGEILVRLNPGLSEILGDVRPLVRLEPDREKNRFLHTAERFFRALADTEPGLVIVLEDLQWSDDASLALLDEIARSIGDWPLLLVGSYRNDEIDYRHGLTPFLIKAREKNYSLIPLPLSPLPEDEIRALFGALLEHDCTDQPVMALASVLHQRSRGNPFLCREMLKHLFENKDISYDDKNGLVLDRDILGKIAMPESIAETLLRRIALLEDDEKELLSCAAVIGSMFQAAFLFDLYGAVLADRGERPDADQLTAVIDRAVSLRFLDRDTMDPDKLSFTHETIRGALYGVLDGPARRRFHRLIATVLEERHRAFAAGPLSESPLVFDLAHHFYEAGDPGKTVFYSYPAGCRAMKNHAYADAIRYLNRALDFISDPANVSDKGLLVAVKTRIADCCLVIGKSDEAIAIFKELLPLVELNHERAVLYKQMSLGFFKKGDWKNCEETARSGLRLLGETLPVGPLATLWSLAGELMVHGMHGFFRRRYLVRTRTRRIKKYSLIVWFYYGLSWSYVLNDSLKFARLLLRVLNIAERRLGKSPELGMSLAFYGVLCSSLSLYERALKFHRRSLVMREALGDAWGIAQTHQLTGFSCYFYGRMKDSMRHYDASIELFRTIGDLKELGNSLSGKIWNNLVVGDYSAAKTAIDEYYDIAVRTGDDFALSYACFYRGLYYFNTGDQVSSLDSLNRAIGLSRAKEIWGLLCMATIDLGRLFMADDDIENALRCYEEARGIDAAHHIYKESTLYLYYELADAHIAAYRNRPEMSAVERKAYMKKIRRLCAVALAKTRRSVLNRGSALRVAAKYYGLAGNRTRAIRCFEQSISLLGSIDFPGDQARALFDYGVFLHAQQREREGRERVLQSYQILQRIGNMVFIQKPREFLGIDDDAAAPSMQRVYRRIKEKIRVSSLVELIRLMSADSGLDAVLDKALAVLLEITGAGRGYFFVADDADELRLLASKTINPGEDAGGYSASIVRRAMRMRELVLTTNAEEEQGFAEQPSIAYHGLKSIMAVPISYQNKMIGACYLDNSHSGGMFGPDDAEIVQLILNQVSLSIGISRLRRELGRLSAIEPGEAFCRRFGITPRERELIVLLIRGLTNKEMGEALDISLSTVENHMRSVYAKTGVRGKLKLINLIKEHP